MYIRVMIIWSLLIPTNSIINKEKEIIKQDYSYTLNKDSIEYYPLNEVMAAIAYHECFNLSRNERWLVMEAFHNRLLDNFNNNGETVKEQLLAPKQFTGLWKYSPQQWKFDTMDTLCTENLKMANLIIAGVRMADQRIYYWAGISDRNTRHGKWVGKHKIYSQTKHWFR